MNKILNAERVEEIFLKCLFKDGEDTSNHIEVEGVMLKIGFNPERVEENKTKIIEMLNELPDNFKEDKGGGWSFLNACMDKYDSQWGEHKNIEQLIMLGIAIKKVKYGMPKELWNALPGGMRYITILN